LQRLQTRYEDSLSRFRISLTNWSRFKFNETIWRRSPDLLLEVSDHIGCIMGYRPDMKIMCPYSCSPQQMGLGTLQMNEIGEGHQISFLASTNDFAILGQRVGISNFPLQIQNPLEISV